MRRPGLCGTFVKTAVAAWLFDTRHRVHWQALLLVMLVVTCWFAFSPQPPGLKFKDADKVQHLLAFGSLTWVTGLSMAPGLRQTVWAVVWMLLFGIFIELVQSQLPTRTADVMDVVADSVGIALGVLLLWGLRRWGRAKDKVI
jgi:VanZ family protein